MENTQKEVLMMVAKQQPGLFKSIAAAVNKGESTEKIMKYVALHTNKNSVTYGMCETVAHYLNSPESNGLASRICGNQ